MDDVGKCMVGGDEVQHCCSRAEAAIAAPVRTFWYGKALISFSNTLARESIHCPQYSEIQRKYEEEQQRPYSCLSSDVLDLIVLPVSGQIQTRTQQLEPSQHLKYLTEAGTLKWDMFTTDLFAQGTPEELVHNKHLYCPLQFSYPTLLLYPPPSPLLFYC